MSTEENEFKSLIVRVSTEDHGLSFSGPGLQFVGFEAAGALGMALVAMSPRCPLKQVIRATLYVDESDDTEELTIEYQDGSFRVEQFQP